jgi:aminopeptidase N
MLKSFSASLALLLAFPILAYEPYVFDKTIGRLPKDVVPTDYELALVPDLDKKQINGQETVHLKFRSASATIQFDTADQTVRDVRFDGKPVEHVVTDNAQQLTTVSLPKAAVAGDHVLSFSYTGILRDDARGLFLQPMTLPDGKPARFLSSSFEPSDARMMFPCWDEPAYRARFQLTVTIPSEWAAISNMPVHKRSAQGSQSVVSFERTPRMSTYLIHLTTGDFARLSGHVGKTEVGIWTVRGQEQDGRYALVNAEHILADYNDYFGYSFPLPKLDGIAVPGGFGGAMENWGAITYSLGYLLASPEASLATRQTVFSVQAHEMAHQWNGDLVTPAWWDDLWLNESFASFMAARETAARHPEWLWWEVQDGDKEAAMDSDASALSRAIHQAVPDEAAANVANDSDILYSKGQAVLRMLEAYLGPNVFREGVRQLMKRRAFSNATSTDLWAALSAASGKDMQTLATGWTEQPGFPLVQVQAQCDAAGHRTLKLTQQRFLDSGTDQSPAHWNIPLRLRIGIHGAARAELLAKQSLTLPGGRCDEALSLNADTVGFYRVRYDAATLASNTRDFGQLPIADRFALLDDEWALAKNGAEPLENYLKLAGAMGSSLDARAWTQITDALGTLEIDEIGTPGYANFTSYARALIKPAADELGWSARPQDSPATNLLRQVLLLDLGYWGDTQVIAEAQRRFALFLKDRQAIDVDEQDTIFQIVANHADRNQFNALHQLARTATDQELRRRLYGALARVSDPQLAHDVASIALSNEILPQDNYVPLGLLMRLAARHPQLAWQAFSTTPKDLFAADGTFAPMSRAQGVPQVFWRAAPLPEIKAWLDQREPKEMDSAVAHYMDWARLRLAEQAAMIPAVDRYIQQLH